MKDIESKVLDAFPGTSGGNKNGVVTKDEFW